MKFHQWVFKILKKQNVTDGRTHAHTDARTDAQRENSIPPLKLRFGGGYNNKEIIIIIFTYSSTLLKVCIKTLAVIILGQRMHTPSTVRDYFPKGGHSLQSYIDLIKHTNTYIKGANSIKMTLKHKTNRTTTEYTPWKSNRYSDKIIIPSAFMPMGI